MKRLRVLFFLARTSLATASVSALAGCSSSHHAAQNPSAALPENRLIALGHSVGGIRLGEARRSVEKALGPGRSRRRGLVSYFGGRLLVVYWWHDRLTGRVEGLETTWNGFHTRSGIHVGSSRQQLRSVHVACGDGTCSRAAGRMPDAPGTVFTMRRGKVVQIEIFRA